MNRNIFSPASLITLLRNMGLRYILFRSFFEIQKRCGWLKMRFPKHTDQQKFIFLSSWRNLDQPFFQRGKAFESFTGFDFNALKSRGESIHQNEFYFFSSAAYKVTDWHTNPETGFRYDPARHWSKIPDFSKEAGDIKYVWEKSRFTFLYDLVRYDFHFQSDQSECVFAQIESWIKANPVNCGPNWKCSQEITLRVLNWTFALQYYKNSSCLTEPVFGSIINSIYRQMQHVEQNSSFSRIAVRNNHAITEALGLYLTGLLYPFWPQSIRWKEKGRKWFEEEIAHQIYDDGTYLQFSMNYHRVVIQLLTWAIKLAELHDEPWSITVYERAAKSVIFLQSCQDEKTGWLPNYGNNDGALFFPLTECHFRDFRPQLGALAHILNIDSGYKPGPWQEEIFWLGSNKEKTISPVYSPDLEIFAFKNGGYFVAKDKRTITFLRCGAYRDRPFQADNLHLDIWADGENILRDAGSYKYNTEEKWSRYFMGTAAHNTVMLGSYDQMRKGPGFMWYNWIKSGSGEWKTQEEEKNVVFEGGFEGFRQVKKGIKHYRKVTKRIGRLYWEIEDRIENAPETMMMHQLWHPSEGFLEKYSIQAFDEKEDEIFPLLLEGWHSDFYGLKEESRQIIFSSNKSYIRTVIKIKTITDEAMALNF